MPVYMIRAGDDGPVKIGHAKNPFARRANLQGGSSQKLILLGLLPGSKPEEQELHRRFASDRISGEWFRFNLAMLVGIEPPPTCGRERPVHRADASGSCNFGDVIRAWPSISDLASGVGQPYGVVKQWRMRNSIPARHWNSLIADAERRGIAGINDQLLRDLAEARTGRATAKDAA
jgi:hypothetical protein